MILPVAQSLTCCDHTWQSKCPCLSKLYKEGYAKIFYVVYLSRVWAPSQDVDRHKALHSHRYHHRYFPKFVRVGWYPTWCKCANHATTLWLRLQNLSNCIPCPCHTYMWFLSTFSGCGWAYGFRLTLLAPQMLPQIWRGWQKSYLMQVCMPLCFDWVCRTFQTASHVHVIHIWNVWAPSQVMDGHMASHSHQYHHRHFPRFREVGWNPTLCKCANHANTLWLRL